MVSLVYPDMKTLLSYGGSFDGFASRPILIEEGGSLMEAATKYVDDRAELKWQVGKLKRPSAETIKKYSYALANFLEWCECHHLDWRTIERGDDVTIASVAGYARMMATGAWCRNPKEPLKQETIEYRAAVAQDFLVFASAKGFRRHYHSVPVVGHGAPKPFRDFSEMPDKIQVRSWLEALRRVTPASHWLMPQTIFETGLRRQEVVRLKESDVLSVVRKPDRFQHLRVKHGTKGGKERPIRLRTAYLDRLVQYCLTDRRSAIANFILRKPKEKVPDELFLNPRSGERWNEVQINRLFGLIEPPCPIWSPHVGRHFYACWTLLEFLEEEANLARLDARELVTSTLESWGRPALIRLQRYLGHSHPDTTDLYLQWASEHLRVNRLAELT